MRFNRTPLNTAIRLALAVSMAGFVGSALAQEKGQPTDAAKAQEAKNTAKQPLQLETVTVTGTRIRSQTITASSPVAEISQEQFKVTGSTRVDDLVNQMPQMSPVFDSFQNNGATGYPTADLRGLGTNRTLVLVDGQRLQAGTNFAADLSQIPAALVKRVDILTGGASAVYGADAVAGVVNFILDDQFEGFQVNAGYSAYQHNNDNNYIQGLEAAKGYNAPNGNSGLDGKSRNIDLIWGSSFADGKGHATSWLTWRQNDSLFQGQRDYSACALNSTGTACGGSGTAPQPNFYVFDSNFNGGLAHLDQANGRWLAGQGQSYNYAPINYYQRPDSRINYGLSLKYEVNEHFRPFLDFMYTNRSSSIQVAESGTFFGQTLSLPCSSPLLGTACADLAGPLGLTDTTNPLTVYVGKRNTEGGPRFFDQKDNSYRAVTGATGDLSTYWSYNVTGVVGQTTSTTVGTHDLLSDRITGGLLGCPAGSFSGCLPYNVWVPGGVNAAAAQALEGTSVLVTSTKLTSVNGYLSGGLPYSLPWADGDTISLVGGAEWRKEQYSFTADSNSQAGNFAGAGGPSLPLKGSTEVKELFAEAGVPLVENLGILDNLNLDLGYRYSDYKLSGSTSTYKLGFSSQFAKNFRIRGGYNRAIRAPNIGELYSSNQIALWDGSDPCAGASPTSSQQNCANTGVSAAQYGNVPDSPAGQYNQYVGGNKNLKPEQADTYTLGFAVTPIEGLEASLDYYDISIKDRIGTIGAATILQQCGNTGNAVLCGLIHRNPATGDLWLGQTGQITNTTNNFGNLKTRGIDVSASYHWDMLGGRMSTSLVGTRLESFKVDPLPGVSTGAAYDCAGKINLSCQNPKWRHIVSLNYSQDWWSVNARWRYFGSMDYILTDGTKGTKDAHLVARGNTLAAANYLDLSTTFQIGKKVDLTLGVNNVTDLAPPMLGNTLVLNGNSPGGYDQAGRYFFGSVSVKF